MLTLFFFKRRNCLPLFYIHLSIIKCFGFLFKTQLFNIYISVNVQRLKKYIINFFL